MIPVFVTLAIYYGQSIQRGAPLEWQRFAAIIVFLLAAASDGLDGYVARRYKQRSALGAILDPIADKGLLLSGIITLSITNWSQSDPELRKISGMVPGPRHYPRCRNFGGRRHPALFHRQQNEGETELDGEGGDRLSDVRDRVGHVAVAISAAVVCRDRCRNLHRRFRCHLCDRRGPAIAGGRARARHSLSKRRRCSATGEKRLVAGS